MLQRLLTQLFARKEAQRRQNPAWQSAIKFRPCLEQLEDRRVLAVATIAATDSTANEGDMSSASFTVTLDSPASGDITVNFQRSGTAQVLSYPDYYVAPSYVSVDILNGQTSAVFQIYPLKDNAREDGGETVVCTLVAGTGYTVGTNNSDSITIVDDPPVVSIAVSEETLDETGSEITFTISRTGGDITEPLVVQLEYSGAADVGDDFTCSLGSLPTEVTILANESDTSFSVETNRDNLVEGNESIAFAILADSDHYEIDEDEATSDLVDDPPVVSITAPDPVAVEPGFVGNPDRGRILFTRTGGDLNNAVTVQYTKVTDFGEPNVYAVLDVDYEGPENDYLELYASSSIELWAQNDALIELNELVTWQLTEDAENYLIDEGHTEATVTIYDATDSAETDPVIEACLCGCDGVSTGVIGELGTFVAEAADGFLRYLSNFDGQAIVAADAHFDEGAETADVIEVVATLGDLDPVSVFYDPSEIVPGYDYRFAIPVDASTLPTGRYHWTLDVIEHYTGSADVTQNFSGDLEINNLSASVFGTGVSLTVLDRLFIQDDGVSWVQGSGTQIWFDDNENGTFNTQAGDPDFSVLTFADTTYTLVTRSGETLIFDEDGLLQTRTDRFSNTTQYAYIDADSDSETDDIETITGPTGEEMLFAYTAGFLSGITDFNGRFTEIEVVGGELVSVTGPDPDDEGELESAVSQFTYADGRMETFTLPSGSATTLGYDHAGGLATRTNASEDVREFSPKNTAAVVDTSGTLGSELDPAPLVLSSSILSTEGNELDQGTSYTADRFGNHLSETDALGNTTLYIRNDDGQATRLIGPVDANGFQLIQDFVYEDGNLVSVLNVEGSGYGLIVEQEWDETWNMVTSTMTYNGSYSPAETLSWTIHTLDELTGAVLSTRRVLGELDDEINEETNDILEEFTYTAAPEISGDPPAGLLETSTNGNGIVTAYTYNEHGLVLTITYAVGTADEGTITYEYDTADNLIAEIDELERRTEYTVDALGNRLSMTLPDPDGTGIENPLESPVLTWHYNVMNRVEMALDALGRETEYVYGAFGNLMSQTLSGDGFDPITVSSGYDDAGRNTSSTDALGRITTLTLDSLGRTVATTLPDPDGPGGENPLTSPVFATSFNSQGQVASTTDALGNVTTVTYSNYGRTVTTTLPDPDSGGPLAAPVYVQHFDLLGRLVEEVDARGGITTYSYNMLSQLVERVAPDPDGELEAYESSVFTWTYDANGNMLTATDANLATTAYVYDARDRQIEIYLPDAETGEPVEVASYVYVYDAAGQLLSETDPLGRITQHQYDNLGREVVRIGNDPDGSGMENPLESPEWHYSFDAGGRLILEVAPNGGETEYEYDLLDNVVLIRLPAPDPGEPLVRPEQLYVFNAASELVSETDPLGRTTLHTLDNLGRETETQTADPDGPGGLNPLEPSVWTRAYDAMSNLVLVVDPLLGETAYEFDNLQRRTKVIDAELGETTFTFDAANNLESLTDPVGNTTTWFNDALNRVVEEENELAASRYFRYDAMSTLIEKTDRSGRVTQYVPDFRGRILEENWLASGELSVSTTTEGSATPADEVQVVTLTDAIGGTFTLSFDSDVTEPIPFDADATTVEAALEALSSIGSGNVSVSGSAGGPWTVTFQGALAGTNVDELTGDASRTVSETILRSFDFAYDEANQLLSVVDPDAEYGFVYDGQGRSTSITADLAGFTSSIVMAQTFDAMNSRTQLAAAIGAEDDFVNDYTFDALSRMTRIERHGQVGGNAVAETRIDLAYNAAGQFTSIDRYADLAGEDFVLSTEYTYDGMGRLATLDHAQGVTALAGYAFTYDAASRITEIDSLLDGLTTYNYDNTSQLVGADFATQTDETHEWDANGNPDETNFDIGPNNQILTDGTFDYAYDAEGNLILKTTIATGETVSFIWDHRNRLTDVVNRDDEQNITQSVHYAYDFLNRWTYRELDADGAGEDPATSIWYAYDGYQIVLAFDDEEATAPDRRYLTGPMVDQILTDETDTGEVRHLLGDHLNTVRDVALLDLLTGDTAVENHITYSSFNAKVADTDAAFATLFGETGRPYDDATGNNNHGHRWLAPSLRRWLSQDPSGFLGRDTNLSRDVGNAPTMATDPTGLIQRTAVQQAPQVGARPLQFRQQWQFRLDNGHAGIASRRIALIQIVEVTISIHNRKPNAKTVTYAELIGIIDRGMTDFPATDTWDFPGIELEDLPVGCGHATLVMKATTQAWELTPEIERQLDANRWAPNQRFQFDEDDASFGTWTSGGFRAHQRFSPPRGQKPLEVEKSPVLKIEWKARTGRNRATLDGT